VAELLGEPLLRATNPIVATYARQEAVDVRISARGGAGRAANDLVDEAEAVVLAAVGEFVWARGDTTWAGALAEALDARGWTLATNEAGTGGALVGLLRGLPAVRRSEVARDPGDAEPEHAPRDETRDLAEADRVRAAGAADVGLSLRAVAAGDDTAVHIGIVTPEGRHAERRLAFLRGTTGADRAAINGAAVLLTVLRKSSGG
jgi:nicotinamide mononucleotide (NMN) deamidase PncC